jgi:hypothetical protein
MGQEDHRCILLGMVDYILHALHGRLNAIGGAFLLGGSKLSRRKHTHVFNLLNSQSNIFILSSHAGIRTSQKPSN